MSKIQNTGDSKPILNGYVLSRKWFDFAFENPDRVKPTHGIIFFFMVEKCNRLGWKEKFGFPTGHAMEATGIKSKNTYYKAFHDLVEWGFVNLIEKSKNANTSNIISLFTASIFKSVIDTVDKSVLDMAMIQYDSRQAYSTVLIDKPIKPSNLKPIKPNRESFQPPSLDVVIDFVKKNTIEKLRGRENSFAKEFFFHQEKLEWKYKGKIVRNWKASAMQWIAREESKSQQKSKENGNTNPNNSEIPRGFKHFEQNTGAIEAV